VSAANYIAKIVFRLIRKITCPHRWKPVNDEFHYNHSHWDAVFNVKRKWECCDCGKRIISANPVSYVYQDKNPKSKEAKP